MTKLMRRGPRRLSNTLLTGKYFTQNKGPPEMYYFGNTVGRDGRALSMLLFLAIQNHGHSLTSYLNVPYTRHRALVRKAPELPLADIRAIEGIQVVHPPQLAKPGHFLLLVAGIYSAMTKSWDIALHSFMTVAGSAYHQEGILSSIATSTHCVL